MRLALLGFGLIGGSIARALHARAPGRWDIAAWSPSGEGPRRAVDAGEIASAAASLQHAAEGATLVVLAAPPLECLDLLEVIAGPLRSSLAPDAVVTDVASTKRRLVTRAGELGLRFIGGHPMAGVESSGFDAADPELFVGRPWIICADGADDAAVRRVEELAVSVGGQPTYMDAATHDAAVAAISHLPLLVSAALVESVFGRDAETGEGVRSAARQVAAGAWRDMTRVARGDVAIGAGIAATNADELAGGVRRLRAVLDGWLEALESPAGPEVEALAARFREARRLLIDAEDEAGR